MFNLIQFQEGLITDFDKIELHGVGDHKARSRAALRRHARHQLEVLGFGTDMARYIVRQAYEMHQLRLEASVGEGAS
jgi:hypothetical protein